MTDSHFIPLANHILHSIQKDLLILKEHQVLDDKTYQDIITLLPTQAKPLFNEVNTINTINSNNNNNNNNNTIRPPLPTRKSTSTSPRITPTPAPRTPSFPKLPSRRSESQTFEPIIENISTVKKIETNTTPPPPPPPSYNASVKTQMVEAVYDYNGDPSTDLSFHKGDVFEVTEHVNDDWWRGTLNGKSGIFPQNHVQVISSTQKHSQILPTTHTYSTTTTIQQQPYIAQSTIHQPYNYPPPPTMMYHAPPPPQQMGSSSSPAFVKNEASAADEHGDGNKVQNMAKKFGGKVGEAAVFGFGATVGSKVANSIF